MNKIKVGFEVTDIYNKGDFRIFIKQILENPNYEVWIISNDDTTAYIYAVGEQLGIPTNRVIVTNFTQDKIQAIIDNGINVYFENLEYVVVQIDETTNCNCILVNSAIPNKFYARPGYQVEFSRYVEELISNNSGEENC